MKLYHETKNIKFTKEHINMVIDGRSYSFKLSDISRKLANANKIDREHYEISASGYGIHWQTIDEDLSIDGLLGIVHKPSFKKKKIVL